jgi:ASC-1-like (ASCH) protein
MEKEHHLKTWPEYFEAIANGTKTFELRKNDRDFNAGDILVLEEYNNVTQQYTGRKIYRRVGFIIKGEWGLPENVCCMSLLPAYSAGVK